MDRNTIIERTIGEGIAEIETSYVRPDQRLKRDGGIAGFTACTGLDDAALLALAEDARMRTERKRSENAEDYWYWRVYQLQVEWVLNVLSASYYRMGLPTPTTPTHRGMIQAMKIMGSVSV